MATSAASGAESNRFDAVAVAVELGPRLAERAGKHDAEDSFVADSYADFKQHKLFSAGVPAELGGGGATHPELCAMLQTIGRRADRPRSPSRCTRTSSRPRCGVSSTAQSPPSHCSAASPPRS
jgi:hypothetical protein